MTIHAPNRITNLFWLQQRLGNENGTPPVSRVEDGKEKGVNSALLHWRALVTVVSSIILCHMLNPEFLREGTEISVSVPLPGPSTQRVDKYVLGGCCAASSSWGLLAGGAGVWLRWGN